ncbi:MAG TPA: toll/interleukin-1 receptor domain-containing protein, partial [Thermoanaerobaculia bacterium]|nr:toll/interleukin-1 receptor domain-containing protein [Thermoanaerobaculia bacterium]
MAGKIFLCYRREDSAGHAGRIYDRLNQRFPGRVFMDVAGIGIGSRWAEVIEQTLGSCEAAVILIGSRWLERRADGTRRIDDPQDSLRAEITTALRLNLKIVPLLVAGAAVPHENELPQDVAPILDWQALRIDDDDFDHDSSRLIQSLERQIKDRGTDLHIEPEAMKQEEIRRLMASAESCIVKGDWITAAQTLKSVLSLDKTHAEAAARLQFVQQQSARAYKPEPVSRPEPPPKGHSSGLWKAFGALGILGGLTVAAVAVIVVVMVLWQLQNSSGTGFVPDTPVAPYDDGGGDFQGGGVEPAPDPVVEEPAAPAMAGEYQLTSYIYQNQTVPSNGGLRLTPISDGRFRFEMVVDNLVLNARLQYGGLLEGQGVNWTMTIQETNDPGAVRIPI